MRGILRFFFALFVFDWLPDLSVSGEGGSILCPARMNSISNLPFSLGPIALALCLFASPADCAPGDLYVADYDSGKIFRFSPDGTKSIFASGLRFPSGLAFDRTGNLFVSEGSGGEISKFTPEGVQSVFASGVTYPSALAFDGAGNLFVSEKVSGDVGLISKITPAGEKSGFAVDRASFVGLTFSTLGNLLATLQDSLSGQQSIFSYAPDGTRHLFHLSRGPGMAFDNAGNFYVTSGDFKKILKYTPAGEESVFASDTNAAISLAFDDQGNLFVARLQSGSILKLATDGSRSTFASGLGDQILLAFEPVVEKLRNISARGLVSSGDNVLIGGFIVGGSALANNAVVVRAIGPSLSSAGVSNPLPDPLLDLHDSSGAVITSNNDWESSQKEQITASGLAPKDTRESAIFATLPTGNYTAVVRSADGATGQALVEIYSVTQ